MSCEKSVIHCWSVDSSVSEWNDAEGQEDVSKKGRVENSKEGPDLILEVAGESAGHWGGACPTVLATVGEG